MSPAASLVDFHETLERIGVPREVAPVETVSAKVRRLQAEAKALAKDHVKAQAASMADVAALASEIATGGEAYHAGTRDVARRLSEDLEARLQILEALNARN
jgi:hypothetical protein